MERHGCAWCWLGTGAPSCMSSTHTALPAVGARATTTHRRPGKPQPAACLHAVRLIPRPARRLTADHRAAAARVRYLQRAHAAPGGASTFTNSMAK